MNDIHLWKKIQEGDRFAFDNMYLEYAGDLHDYGRRFTEDHELVSDTVQEVFLYIWEKKSKLHIKESLKGYLFLAFRNRFFARLKKQNRERSFLSSFQKEVKVSFQLSFEDKLISNQESKNRRLKLNKAIEKLEPRKREAIFLKYHQNLSYEEIAGIMSVKVPYLYKLISVAVKELRESY